MEELPEVLEVDVLAVLCCAKLSARKIVGVLDPEMFSSQAYKLIAKKAQEYLKEYKEPPGVHLYDLLENDIKKRGDQGKLIDAAVDRIGRTAREDSFNERFVVKNIQAFIRSSSMRAKAEKFARLVEENKLDEAEALMHERSKSADIFAPGMYLHEADKMLSFMDVVEEDYFPTGIAELDEKHYCPARGTMFLLIAPMKRGKCLAGDTPILTWDGSYKPIKEIVETKHTTVISADANGKLRRAIASDWIVSGEQPCYKVTTKSGRTITGTKAHLLKSMEGWRKIEKLRPKKDYIAVLREAHNLGEVVPLAWQPALLGYLLADGGFSAGTDVSFTKADPVIAADFDRLVALAGCSTKWHASRKHCYVHPCAELAGKHDSNYVRDWLASLGLMGHKSSAKFIPDVVFTWVDSAIAEFLAAYFSCDGSIYFAANPTIELVQANLLVPLAIQELLSRLGVFSRYSEFSARLEGRRLPGYSKIVITGLENIAAFAKLVGFGEARKKQRRLFKALQSMKGSGSNRKSYGTRAWSANFFYDQVVSVECVGVQQTYDISVGRWHNFVAGTILAHNSWFLINCAKEALLAGRSVLHITLENSEKITGKRYIQSLYSLGRAEAKGIDAAVPRIHRDQQGKITGVSKLELPGKELNEAMRPTIRKKLLQLRSRQPVLIKNFPSGTLTINQLDAYMHRLETTYNFVPDMLVVDYPDLMKIRNPENKRGELGQIFVDLRGLAVERNCALVTATQGTRGSVKVKVIGIDDVAEDISKVATADTIVTYNQTKFERKLNTARLFAAAARDAEDQFMVGITQNYKHGQFCLDSWRHDIRSLDKEIAEAFGEEDDEEEEEVRGKRRGHRP